MSQSRDFSYFSLFTAGLACFAPLASAYTQPQGAAPEGNPFHTPNTESPVTAGSAYTVTWTPTTNGTVTLVLLKGPSTDCVPQYPIVEHLDNSGSYSWTPASDLQPGTLGYGIQLIDDTTGAYQYTTQFGVNNPSWSSSSSGWSGAQGWPSTDGAWAASSSSWATSASWTSTPASWTSAAATWTSTAASWTSSSAAPTSTVSTTSAAVGPVGTGSARNGTVTPTASWHTSAVPTPISPSSTTSPKTNGAGSLVGSVGAVALAAGLAAFLS